jgi:hypothetical protein
MIDCPIDCRLDGLRALMPQAKYDIVPHHDHNKESAPKKPEKLIFS